MSPNEAAAVKELLNSRLDDLKRDFHAKVDELKDGQNRIERETHKRLDRIEEQTTRHNGRMTALEKQRIHDEAIQEEREHVAAVTESKDVEAHRPWRSVMPSIIGGSVSGLIILLATLLVADKL